VGNFVPATQGISNFVTAPDYIPTVLLQNASEQQIVDCMEACRESGNIYNVYVQTANSDEEWVWRIQRIADVVINAENEDPTIYFINTQ
jgi:hypothetical protein